MPKNRLLLTLRHPAAQKLRSMVHEIVGRINGRYGTLTENPIHHLDRQLSFHELCALYAVTDVLLVASLRDGMNLVSYEYVACQSDNAGADLHSPCPT
jgi:trehalose 6-phosphate synthase/phosphatase